MDGQLNRKEERTGESGQSATKRGPQQEQRGVEQPTRSLTSGRGQQAPVGLIIFASICIKFGWSFWQVLAEISILNSSISSYACYRRNNSVRVCVNTAEDLMKWRASYVSTY